MSTPKGLVSSLNADLERLIATWSTRSLLVQLAAELRDHADETPGLNHDRTHAVCAAIDAAFGREP